jgi:hypothetical protein
VFNNNLLAVALRSLGPSVLGKAADAHCLQADSRAQATVNIRLLRSRLQSSLGKSCDVQLQLLTS